MKQHQNVINPLPWSVSALVLLMIVPEVYILGADLRLWGSATARFDLLRAFALFPEALGFALRTGYFDPSLVMRLFSFSFVHGHWLSALVSVALVLAMGKFVAQVLGNITMLLIFFATSFLGALIYSLVAGAPQLLFGGTVGFYGLIGAFTLVQFIDAKGAFQAQLMAFRLLAVLLVFNLLVSALYGQTQIWVAEFSAALAGLIGTALLHPSVLRMILHRLRER